MRAMGCRQLQDILYIILPKLKCMIKQIKNGQNLCYIENKLKIMNFFEISQSPAPEMDYYNLDKDQPFSTWDHKESQKESQYNGHFMESYQIQYEAFPTFFPGNEDQQAEVKGQAFKIFDSRSLTETKPLKSKKNSNSVKKIGRMILKRLEEYDVPNSTKNEGVTNMLTSLHQKMEGVKGKRRQDCFNTSHLQALFDIQDISLSQFNLRTTRKIFSSELRKEVFRSSQLKGDNRLIYLNTFKCCSLRFMNKRLAYRLQASENSQ